MNTSKTSCLLNVFYIVNTSQLQLIRIGLYSYTLDSSPHRPRVTTRTVIRKRDERKKMMLAHLSTHPNILSYSKQTAEAAESGKLSVWQWPS